MKTLFTRIAFVACLTISISTFAYTSTDCTSAEQLASQGVIGYRSTCREYNLDRTITRQEVAAVTLKVGEVCGSIQNIPPQGSYRCENVFSDVSTSYPNEWVCRVAETLAQEGVISQNDVNTYGDVFFRPLKNVTRAEALAMILNGADLEFQGTIYDDWRFGSTGAVTWQKPLIQYAFDRDIITSITGFSPNTNAYRRDVFNYASKAINLCRTNNGNYNNYNNTYNCGIGQYSSGNTCYSCNSLPANAYFATANSCVWTCNSGFYKSGNACIPTNNYYYGTTGQCGSTINSCLSGTFYDTTDYGNYAYWNCTGSNGTAVSCNAYNNNYYGNCTVGQYYSGNMCLGCTSKPSYAYYTTAGTCDWVCSSGYYKSGNTCIATYGTTGQCGSTINSCLSGTFYDTTDYGNYAYWNCTGSNGTAVSCSAYNNNYYGTNGQCGSTINSCISGTFYDTTDYGNYAYWNCIGSNGSAVSCSAYNNNYYGTTGQCGSTINSCLSGTFYDTTDYGNYAYWNCTGSNGSAVSCSAFKNAYNYDNCSIPMPTNAYYTNAQSCWSFNAGFVQINNMCVWWN